MKGKGNVRLLIGDIHVFYASKNVNKYKVVSKAQTNIGLILEGGVCTEAANMIIDKVINDYVCARWLVPKIDTRPTIPK